MKLKLFYVSFIIAIVGLSMIPLQHASAKGFIFGGQPDLRISLLASETYGDNMHIPKENFHLILDDMDKLPVLFGSTIFPAIKEQLLKHESNFRDQYMESIGVVYNLNKDTMDANKMQIAIRIPSYYVTEVVNVEPANEAKMSIIKRVGIQISVYANLTHYEYGDILNEIEKQTIHRINILSSNAKDTLNKHGDELLASVLEGEGSLANKIRIQAISMEILGDIVRVNVSYPEGKDGRVKFINEIRPAIIFESRVNSIMLGEPQIVTEYSTLNPPLIGRELIVQSELKNMVAEDMQFTYIVQVRNQDGITVSLGSVEGSLASSESIRAALAWTPDAAGTYEVRTFVWSGLGPLAPSKNISITVMNDVMDVEQSYNDFPITTYIGFPESKKRHGYCVPFDSHGGTCDSFIGYKEYSLTLFSEEKRDIRLSVANVPKGMWVKLVPQRLNVGPDGASARMVIAGGEGLPLPSLTQQVQSLIIQAESNDEKTTIADLHVRTDIPTLTVLHSPRSIELPGKIDVWGESSFRVFGAVYDPDESSSDSLPVNLSVLGLLQEDRIIPLPSWLEVDILTPSFSLSDSQPHYFVIGAARTSSTPLGVHTIVIEETIDGQRFTQNLQIKVNEPTRLGP